MSRMKFIFFVFFIWASAVHMMIGVNDLGDPSCLVFFGHSLFSAVWAAVLVHPHIKHLLP